MILYILGYLAVGLTTATLLSRSAVRAGRLGRSTDPEDRMYLPMAVGLVGAGPIVANLSVRASMPVEHYSLDDVIGSTLVGLLISVILTGTLGATVFNPGERRTTTSRRITEGAWLTFLLWPLYLIAVPAAAIGAAIFGVGWVVYWATSLVHSPIRALTRFMVGSHALTVDRVISDRRELLDRERRERERAEFEARVSATSGTSADLW